MTVGAPKRFFLWSTSAFVENMTVDTKARIPSACTTPHYNLDLHPRPLTDTEAQDLAQQFT